MTIRDADPADLPAIVAIYNAAIPGRLATADTEPISVASRAAWLAAHAPTPTRSGSATPTARSAAG